MAMSMTTIKCKLLNQDEINLINNKLTANITRYEKRASGPGPCNLGDQKETSCFISLEKSFHTSFSCSFSLV
jgi:hypothetical protein